MRNLYDDLNAHGGKIKVDLYLADYLEVGTVSKGDTVEDAITNLKETISPLPGRVSSTRGRQTLLTIF